MTNNKTTTENAGANTADKPVGRAFIPVKEEKGKSRWIEAGPVWATKDGEGQILDLQAVPLSFLTDGFPAELRILIKPVNQD